MRMACSGRDEMRMEAIKHPSQTMGSLSSGNYEGTYQDAYRKAQIALRKDYWCPSVTSPVGHRHSSGHVEL